jgi:hypothetical protein
MDDHRSWYIHRRHPFGSSSACFSAKSAIPKSIRIRRLGHKRQRAGPKSSRGDRPSETRIRAFRQGWKGRILASIPARPTTWAHATQAPPHLRAPARVDQQSERGTGRLAGPWTRLRGAVSSERLCSPPTWTSTLLSNR